MNEPRSFTDREAARLSRLYAQAEDEILRQINFYIASGRAPGTTRNLQQLLGNVQLIRADLLQGAKTWTQKTIPKVYQKGIDWADSGIPEGSPIQPGFFAVHQQAMLQLANELYGRLNEVDQTIDNSVRTVARRVDDIFRQRQLEVARPAVTGYKTSKQQARQLQKDLAERGVCGFVDKAGREWSLKNYSQMAAITVTNNTLREGTKNRLVERGYDLCRISVHIKPCPACEKWQGQTLSISGNDPEYTALAEATGSGLFHPRCKHAMSLSPVEKDRFLARLKGEMGEEARNKEIERLARAGGYEGPLTVRKTKPKAEAKPKIEATKPIGFIPAANIREANKRLADLLSSGRAAWLSDPVRTGRRFREMRGISYGKPKKMGLELANVVLNKLEQFDKRCQSLGIPSIQGMSSAGKAAGLMGDGRLGLNYATQERRLMETPAKALRECQTKIDSYKEHLARAEKTLQENPGYEPSLKWKKTLEENIAHQEKKIKAIQAGEEFDWHKANPGKVPFVTSELYQDGIKKIESDLEHEFAHHIHQQLDVKTDTDYRNPPLEIELFRAFKHTGPTKYSLTNSKEWFAENYTLYMMGKKNLVDPYCLPILDRITQRQGT